MSGVAQFMKSALALGMTSLRKDVSGNTVLAGANAGEVYRADLVGNSVFLLGGSLVFRANRYVTATTSSIAGDVLTINGTFTDPPVPGSNLIITDAIDDAQLIGNWPILTSSVTVITAQLDHDATGAVLGDGKSVTLGCVYAQVGYIHYAASEAFQAGRQISIAGIWGKPGGTIQNILDEGLSRAIASPARRVAVMIGLNDLSDASPETVDATIARLESLYTQLLAAGKLVDAFTITPLNSGYSTAATATPNILLVNAYIRGKCANTPRMTLVDAYTALKNDTDNYAETGMLLTDNIHFSPLGARLVGEAYYAAIASSLTDQTQRSVLSAADAYVDAASWNLLVNPLFTGSAGTAGSSVTGPVPDGWTVERNTGTVTCIVTQQAHPSGYGNDIQIAHTTTGASQYNIVIQDITARVAVGDRLTWGAEMQTVDVTAGQYIKSMLEITVGGVVYHAAVGDRNVTFATGEVWPPAGERINLLSPEITIPAGTTSVRYILRSNAGAVGQMTSRWGRPFCRKVV